jgi:hypothetical protein
MDAAAQEIQGLAFVLSTVFGGNLPKPTHPTKV